MSTAFARKSGIRAWAVLNNLDSLWFRNQKVELHVDIYTLHEEIWDSDLGGFKKNGFAMVSQPEI